MLVPDWNACPRCQGEGEVEVRASARGYSPDDEVRPCPDCRGDGMRWLPDTKAYARAKANVEAAPEKAVA